MLNHGLNHGLFLSLFKLIPGPAPACARQQTESCHRHGPKTEPAQTAKITKCHVIFIVFFKFLIEIAGGDGINQFVLKIRAF
jgi:hypothetical protein